jgi:diguanylate cyclase (GGDEF)-like protein
VLKVYDCVANAHDLRLVALAAAICALASLKVVGLLQHLRKSSGRVRSLWLVAAAASGGFGVWATHFIAMLAFSPGIPTGYDIALTASSLILAIALTGLGLAVAICGAQRWASVAGGAIVGGGIAAMHYLGMAAFEIAGRVVWDLRLAAASIALGIVLAAAAIFVGVRANSAGARLLAALLLTLAILGAHFIAMAAATIVPDPRIVVSEFAVPAGWLAIPVALASVAVLLLTAGGLVADLRGRRRSDLEADHMRGLANAVVEGLVICDGETIAAANEAFAALSGIPADQIAATPLARAFPDQDIGSWPIDRPNELVEASLANADGGLIPVELIFRSIIFANKPHLAIAVRDLRIRKRAEAQIRHLADHDPLTGLPNRRDFARRLDSEIAAAKANGTGVALLYVDLDGFTEVNDLYGQAAGDRQLQSVAHCVSRLLRENQILARIGGDEFAVIAPGLSNPAAAGRIAEKILDAIRIKNEASPDAYFTSASVGVALYPSDSSDPETLLNQARAALLGAKAQGRGAYRFFEAAMGAQVRHRRQIEHGLRHAVTSGELELAYQPIAQISSGEIVGFEALVRWTHPSSGPIGPDVFIPIAEECGLIGGIGEWVLRKACREAAGWKRPLTLAVNVSAVQLRSEKFAPLVREALVETGLAPHRLELEITETALITDMTRTLATLRHLKSLGVRIVMDDFGTGYSSLSTLRAFPFDKIKIDRSLIRSVDENDEAKTIIRAVMGLGQGLGLLVLAEGIETPGELQFLANAGCVEGQGYLLGRPAPIEQFCHLVQGDGATGATIVSFSEEKPRAAAAAAASAIRGSRVL